MSGKIAYDTDPHRRTVGPLRRVTRWADGLRRSHIPLWSLLAFAVAAISATVFFEIGDEVLEGDALKWDRMVLLALREPGMPSDPLGPPWLEEAAVELTAIGSLPVIGLLSVSLLGFLLVHHRFGSTVFATLSIGGGLGAAHLLKLVYGRPRPELVEPLTVVHTQSFPSGHTMGATVVVLTLAALVARLIPSRAGQTYVFVMAACWAGSIGLTRVYLGVHWPSDVLAGWAMGVSWAAGCWAAVSMVQNRRTPESATS